MTEQECIKYLEQHGHIADDVKDMCIKALEEVQQCRTLGTFEELKELKDKNTPRELAEHNFRDEVHHYLCPSCGSIVSYNQNYCEECGQRLGE